MYSHNKKYSDETQENKTLVYYTVYVYLTKKS